jgi:acyl carrier protein
VVTRKSAEATEPSLRDYLTRRLAAFKVPTRVLIVDEIPKGATGKINRKGLAEVFAEALRVGFIAPKNNLEAVVANIYAEVLKVSRVGVNDNFFSLGGDSLRAMQVISRVRSLFSVNLPIATLFLKTTVLELAEEIDALVKALPPASREAVCAELKEVSGVKSQLRVAVQRNHDDSEH